MKNSHSESYKSAGVNVTAGYEAVRLMKSDVERTKIPGVLSGIGGFGAMFMPELSGMKEPVLVSGTDGVGTKIKLAMLLDKHDTIGIDAVAMCANDIICCGARPLFFLDYIACGKNYPEKIASIVKGVADGCVSAGCALIGGETAEHPGLMAEEDYDLAGFCVGIADKSELLDNKNVAEGDIVIGLASTGCHSNAFSLTRKVFGITDRASLEVKLPYADKTLGEELLTPTRIYVKPILSLMEQGINIKSIANITGGGFYENIPRSLPEHLSARIIKSSYSVPQLFKYIEETGGISERDMYNTYNMGIGMTLIVPQAQADTTVTLLETFGVPAYCIGEVTKGDGGIELL
jgi:phosphoribosylformylglycinamidine cyclo-ligase